MRNSVLVMDAYGVMPMAWRSNTPFFFVLKPQIEAS